MLQDKEGGIHVSCDPLASLPLEEIAQSAASAVPLPSALLSSLARNASGNDLDNKAKACQPLVPDTQLLPVSPPSAPLDRFLLDASPAGAAGSVSRSASSGPSSAGATALEVAHPLLPRMLRLGCVRDSAREVGKMLEGLLQLMMVLEGCLP